MEIYLLQSLCLVGLFLSMVTLTLLPSQFLRKRFAHTDTLPARFETLMSLANCVSGGVFLATFFVGLLPEVRREMNEILVDARLSTNSLPLTEVVVLLGFFLAVFVEQFALTVKHGHEHSHATDDEPIDDSVATVPTMTVLPVNRQSHLTYDDADSSINSTTTAMAPDEQRWKHYMYEDADASTDGEANFNGSGGDGCGFVADPSTNNPENDLLLTAPSVDDELERHSHHSHGGHGHSHGVEDLLVSTSRLRFGILLFSLGVHSLFEGMALGLQDAAPTLLNLFVGVWIHECLIAFALGFSMVKLRLSACRLWQTALAFASLIPFGQLLGLAIGSSRSWSGRVLGTVLQALAAGTFIQVTFLDIIPDGLGAGDSTARRMLKVALLFLGFVAIAIITFAGEL